MKVATSAPKNIVILSSTSNILKISALLHQLIILSRFINTNKLLDIGISYY
jgi:hypothetical protein